MTTINSDQPVLVTGATGYVAGWIIKRLLEEGLTVHATVRDPQDVKKRVHLDELAKNSKGNLRYFKADLLSKGSFAEAMQGCELVYHTASPFTSVYKDAQKELIDPAVNGTANVLEEACKTPGVKRVVLTSSCAAIYSDASDLALTPKKLFTEEIWNTTASLNYQPYSYSKTLAEKKAWEIANTQQQWDLVVINPSLVMGPPINPKTATSESVTILKQLVDGTSRFGVPKVGLGMVDVRDLAEAHFKAGFTPQANGRNIISAHNTNLLEMSTALYQKYGKKYPLTNKALPKALVWLIGPLLNKTVTRSFVSKNVNIEWKADNSKAIRELGISYRPLSETMVDSFEALLESGVIARRS